MQGEGYLLAMRHVFNEKKQLFQMLGCSQLEDFSDKLFFFTATKGRQITRPLGIALNPRLLVFYGQGVWHTTEMVYGDI